MTQQQFKIRLSVSTKLLLAISLLIATTVFFLNLSAVTLFKSDKKAYVYDSLATSVVLAGREFSTFLDQCLGTLKLVAGSVDIQKPLSEQGKKNIQFYLENQKPVIGAELFSLTAAGQPPAAYYRQFLPRGIEQVGLKSDADVKLDLRKLAPGDWERLLRQGYLFKNITRAGLPPLLAAVLADTRQLGRGPVAIAVGYADLGHFVTGTNSFSRFLIADRSGEVLFNSEARLMYASINLRQDPIFTESWSSAVKTAAREYTSPEGVRTLGSFYKPGLELVALSQIDYDKAMEATYVMTEKFIVLALAALGIMIVLALVFSKRLVAPLHRLFVATGQVSAGNFNVSLPVTSKDEIGALTGSFVAMSRRISDLLQEMVDKVRVEQEVEIARTVQQSLFPPALIEDDRALVATHYQSASECGGDWLGCFRVGNSLVLVIADATGHGLPSALMTASARSCFSVIEKLASGPGATALSLDPSEMLSLANRVVYDSAQGKIMMTCFVAIVDFDSHVIRYASAAHNPPWLFGARGLQSLLARGQRLGEARDLSEPYEAKSIEFGAGDTLVLYTDGLLEGSNLAREQYGKKQARAVLESAIAGSPQEIVATLMADFSQHNAGKALDDDVTLAVMRART